MEPEGSLPHSQVSATCPYPKPAWSVHTLTSNFLKIHLNLLAPELFFLNFSTPAYKMWMKHEPNILELWNKLHFEEKKTESIYHV